MSAHDETEETQESILKDFIRDSSIEKSKKEELLGMNLRAIFDIQSHQYKSMNPEKRVSLFQTIILSDVPFGHFLENLVLWLEEVSMGMPVLNIGEALQENIRGMNR